MDYTDPVAQVRLLTTDVDYALLTDDQLVALLALNGDSVRLAAADALELIATSEVLVSKKIRTQDLQTDGPAVAAELRALAGSLRAQAARTGEGVDEFSVVDTIPQAEPWPEATERWRWGQVWGL